MLKLDYDSQTLEFKAKLKKDTPEFQAKISQVPGSEEIASGFWSIPRKKQSIKKLYNIFGRGIDTTDKAYNEMIAMKKDTSIKLDYDNSSDKFELYVDFSKKHKSFLKYEVGKCYKRTSKGCWSIPNNYWTLKKIYKEYGESNIKPTKSAKEVLNNYTEKIETIENDLLSKLDTIKTVDRDKIPVDFDFKGEYELYDHQLKMWWAAKEFLKTGAGFAYFADAGTGKSAPAVNVIEYLLENGYINKALIITPASLKYNFAEQFEIHSDTDYNVLVSYNKDQRKGKSGRRWKWTDSNIPIEEYYEGYNEYLENETNAPVQIVNYKCISKEWKKFKGYDLWLADEVHKLRRRTSNRSKAMRKLSKHIPYRLGMTGTPICKDALDLFSQMNIIDPDILPNRYQNFRDKIAKTFTMEVNGRKIKQVYDFKPEGIDWLNDKIYKRAIRYRIGECVDLPEKQYERVVVDMPPKVDKFYKELVKNRVGELGEMGDDNYKYVDAANGLVVVSYARQVASGFVGIKEDGEMNYHTLSDFKVKALMDLLERFNDEQVIIWYRHKHLLGLIKDELDKRIGNKSSDLHEKEYGVINGEIDSMEKSAVSKNFRKGKLDYILASIDVTEGWQGQSAKIAIFLENKFTFDVREQAEGRIHREGQKGDTIFYDIVAKETIDLKILRSIAEGESISEKTLAENIPEWAPFVEGE